MVAVQLRHHESELPRGAPIRPLQPATVDTVQPGSGRSGRRQTPLGALAPPLIGLVLAVGAGSLYDVLDPNKAALLPLVAAPLVAAVALSPRATALISALCVALLLVLPQSFVTNDGVRYLRLSALVSLSVVAVVASVLRQRLVSAQIRLEVAADRAEETHRRALELNDRVHQNIFAARAWSQMGRKEDADAALDRALEATSSLLAGMLEGADLDSGYLTQRSVGEELDGPDPGH